MWAVAAAVLALLGAVLPGRPALADTAAVPAIANPDFSATAPTGLPASWNVWNPAGRAAVAVEPSAGPDGGPAVHITSVSGADARYALTQQVPVYDSTPRALTLSGMVKGDGLTGGFSMLRIQAYDAVGKVVVPVTAGPYLTGTFGWREYSADVVLPAGARRLSVEPMLDRTAGSLWVTQVALTPTQPRSRLTASPTPAGPVELTWSFAEPVPPGSRYDVYRADGTQAPATDPQHFLRTAYAPTTADNTALPGHPYTYLVQAVTASGDTAAVTPASTAATPASFERHRTISTLTAITDAPGRTHVSWSLADGVTPAGVTLRAGGHVLRSLGTGEAEGSTEAGVPAGTTLRLVAGRTTLATATAGSTAHPRAVATRQQVAKIRQALAAHATTTTEAWKALLARVAGPDSAYITNGSGGLYKARDAALAYAVTGNDGYAQTAYTALMGAADFVAARDTNEGLELGRADLLLAPAYDWAYDGWSEQQRADVRHVMTRAADLLSTYHHSALDGPEKTSNWVGVVRTTELALLLAARGDGDFGLYDQRIAFLTDQVAQHLDQAYTDDGYTQEGWDYLHYTELYMFPALYFAQGTGLHVLDSHFARPKFWNVALHDVSSRAAGDVAQYGVSGPNGQTDGTFPLLFPETPPGALPGLLHLYDRVQGDRSATGNYDGVNGLWTLLYYPEQSAGHPRPLTAPEAWQPILDDVPGFYSFRSGYQDAGDQLVVTSDRNDQHNGWASAETFSLSWIGDDTTWAAQGGKQYTAPLQWSKPLVDGRLEPYTNEYTTVTGAGRTLASRAFAGQGGGYLHLDGSRNFGVTTADREEVVDLAGHHDAHALVAIDDTYADTVSHEWDWDLRPGPGVVITLNPQPAPGAPLFTFTSPNGAVLSGFAADTDGLTAQVVGGTLRLSRTGTSATFSLALATSGHALTAISPRPGVLRIDHRQIDFAHLSATGKGGLPHAR